MKNIFKKFIIICIICLILVPSINVYAVNNIMRNPSIPRVIDDVGVLTNIEKTNLENEIFDIQNKYKFDVVIHIANNMNNMTKEAYTDMIYEDNEYGYGDNYDGIIFTIGMLEREYIVSTGGRGIDIFTNYGIDHIVKNIHSELSEGELYLACESYLKDVAMILYEAETGTPYDKPKTKINYVMVEFIIILCSIIISSIFIYYQKNNMNNARNKTQATNYFVRDSLKLKKSQDIFLYSTIARTKKSKSNTSSSGTRSSSSGRSYRSGGGKF